MTDGRAACWRRLALSLTASVLVAVPITLAGLGPAHADPYDDDSGTEQVEPDYSDYEPDYEPEPDYSDNEPAPPDYDTGEDTNDPDPDTDSDTTDSDGSDSDPEPDDSDADQDPTADDPGEPDPDHGPLDDGTGPSDEDQTTDGPDASGADEWEGATDTAEADTADADTADAETAQAPQGDVDTAQADQPTELTPAPAQDSEVDVLRESIMEEMAASSTTVSETSWNGQVSAWSSEWVSYDRYYRPIFLNPYRNPLQLVYTYADAPHIVTVGPLQRAIVETPTPGVYSFTAVVHGDTDKITNVGVGSFSGGGYRPVPGQPPPPKPPALQSSANALVQIKYPGQSSEPFRVTKLTDLGDDPTVGARHILLDDEIPAWGQWTQGPGGERLFEITSTQQLPGLSPPGQTPLPGYPVQLTSNTSGSGVSVWVWVALTCGGLALVAVAAAVALNRRRRVSS